MEIVSLFNGEERRARAVTTIEEISRTSAELARGDGWGQRVRGTLEELREVGAWENQYGGWLLQIGSLELDCEVE